MRPSSVAVAILAVTLAACGGGGSGGSAGSAAAPAAAADSPMAAAQAYADAHPQEALVPYGLLCDTAVRIAELRTLYRHISFVALGPSKVRQHGIMPPETCVTITWSVHLDHGTGMAQDGIVIGRYVVEKVGAPVSNGTGGTNFPWTGHLARTSSYEPLVAASSHQILPLSTVTDGVFSAHQNAAGAWVIDAFCTTENTCGRYPIAPM